MAQNPSIIFASYGSISEEIADGIVPHFPDDETHCHTNGSWVFPVGWMEERIPTEQNELRRRLKSASLLVVGFCGARGNEYWAIQSAHAMNRPCGLILDCNEKPKVAALSVIHSLKPFRFVIVKCSIYESNIRELFPGTPFLWDISSLLESGKQIAEFISKQARRPLLEELF